MVYRGMMVSEYSEHLMCQICCFRADRKNGMQLIFDRTSRADAVKAAKRKQNKHDSSKKSKKNKKLHTPAIVSAAAVVGGS